MFPAELRPDATGLAFVGGVLDVATIEAAYARGLFPWRGGVDIPWYLPDPRAVLPVGGFRASRSLAKLRDAGGFEVAFDRDVVGVQRRCATTARRHEDATWISPDMMAVYAELVARGIAHGVEILRDGVPVGGLYGLAFGRFFHGESMYYVERDASKLALWALSTALAARDFELIDCQVPTAHLTSLGVETWPSTRYLARLAANRDVPSRHGSWATWTPAW
ncbi:MAG: leucyl/phenylalanyl-tRNA--protein transferase [Proteobacteria bacterium]|nr:leucyl/phenylalanyl-tRNA--protein transferase [Pseudomonadota bacterium]